MLQGSLAFLIILLLVSGKIFKGMSSFSRAPNGHRKIPDWHVKLVMFFFFFSSFQSFFAVENGLRANPPVFPSVFLTVCFMFPSPKSLSFYRFDHKPSVNISYIFKPQVDREFIGHGARFISLPFFSQPLPCSGMPVCEQKSLVHLPPWTLSIIQPTRTSSWILAWALD